ncbi:MAG TPA: HEAT repeat domain-containing protein [Mycobacteriales bacterium]|nr:HEAT repeat domain-containing protein [Mycobacteriales bacterium]
MFEFGPLPSYPGLGLKVFVPGRPGYVSVVPVSLRPDVKSWGDPFPGDGVPHWQLTEHGADGQPGEDVFSCRIEVVADAFGTWLGLAGGPPPLRCPPPATDHLARILQAPPPQPPASLQAAAVAVAAELPAEERRRFEADLAALAVRRIAGLFPRGDNGRVATGERVLLCCYGPQDSGRRRWLHVVARSGQLQLAVEPLIGENHRHRWDQARWMWDARVVVPPPAERWGVAGDEQRAGRSLELIDAGDIAAALALYGVGASGSVARVLAGEPLSMHEAQWAPRWAQELRRVLWELAPWRLDSAAPATASGAARLITFGGQRSARKAALVLTREPDLRLAIHYTGTNRRLPGIAFARLLEQDLARFGLAAPQLPAETGTAPAIAPAGPVDAGKVDRYIGVLTAKLRQFEHTDRDAAIAAGRKLDPAVAGGVLAAAMDDPDPQVRRRALDIAGELRNRPCIGAAMARLDDDDWQVRHGAVQHLRRVGHAPALAVVARWMLADPAEHYLGALMLRSFGEKPGAAALRVHLAADDPAVRAGACLTIVKFGGKALAPLLAAAAAADTPQVAGAALRALEVMAVPQLADASARAAARPDAADVDRERARFASYHRQT